MIMKSKRMKHALIVTTSVPSESQDGFSVFIVSANIHKKNILPIKIGDSDDNMQELVDCSNDTDTNNSNFEDKDSAIEGEVFFLSCPRWAILIPQEAETIFYSGLRPIIGRSFQKL
eukprot:3688866-Ditylum_brightwellii.AAC.1